jgi:hypothetical protein
MRADGCAKDRDYEVDAPFPVGDRCAAGKSGMGPSVRQTQAVPTSWAAFSLTARSFADMKALTTCKGAGRPPVSSSRAFGNAATVRASYRNGLMNRRPWAMSSCTSAKSCTPSNGIHCSLVSIRLAASISYVCSRRARIRAAMTKRTLCSVSA